MTNLPKTKSPVIIYGVFILGILCTIAFRSLTILSDLSPALVRPVWYFGVIGYIFFFLHRYHISVRRKNAILDFQLIEAINKGQSLSEDQRDVLLYLLNSIIKSKENINYFAIFILSALALMVDIILCYKGS